MANTTYKGSDLSTTTVFATAAFPTTLTFTDWIEVRGFTHVEFYVILSNGQQITDLELQVQYATLTGGSDPRYPVMVEAYDAGPPVQIDQNPYVVDADGVFSGTDGSFGLPVAVHGRYMRLGFYGGPSAGTDQATVQAYRRTS